MLGLQRTPRASSIPGRAGVGLKPEHYREIVDNRPGIGWFEVHAENYMEPGGPAHHYLTTIREIYPLSVHGVGLSIGGAGPIDDVHLARLRAVCDRYEPGLVSEHLAWSTHEGAYLNDLLPIPYNARSLDRVVEHIDHVQSVLKRTILLENPSTYIEFASSTLTEIEFLKAIVSRSGCRLLLDVNNVFVSSTNHGYDAEQYLDDFPMEHVGEIHLAGYARDADETGATLLIDAHGCEVDQPVWLLFRRVLARSGPVPTLIEWDNDVPAWSKLASQARIADNLIKRAGVTNAGAA